MLENLELKEGAEAKRELLEISNKINEHWEGDPDIPTAQVVGNLLRFPGCIIGVCNQTDTIIVLVFLGTSCEIIGGIVTALFEFRHRLKLMDAPIYAHRDGIVIGAEAFEKYGEDVVGFRMIAQSLDRDAYLHLAQQKKR